MRAGVTTSDQSIEPTITRALSCRTAVYDIMWQVPLRPIP